MGGHPAPPHPFILQNCVVCQINYDDHNLQKIEARELTFLYLKIKKSNKLSYVAIQRQKVLNNSDMIAC